MIDYAIDFDAGPVVKRLKKIGADMPEINRRILGLLAFEVITRADSGYLRGPRPERLGRISGNLAQSLTKNKPGNIWVEGADYITIGTNMPYAAFWEYGGMRGTKHVEARPYMKPAFDDIFGSGRAQLIMDREMQRELDRRMA